MSGRKELTRERDKLREFLSMERK